MTHRIRSNNTILITCIILTPLINLGLDLYTPSLPAIATAFHASHFAIKLTILIYTVTFGITQPLIGPLCDHHGRKPFIWSSLIIYLLASILASTSHSLKMLYLCRFGQGVGAAFIAAVIKAVLVDCFHGKKLAKANSYFSLAWSLTPILAPVIGGWLQQDFFWQANFYFMAGYSVLCIILSGCLLPETLNKAARPQKRPKTLSTWRIILSNKSFIAGCTIMGIQFALLVIYYMSAPFIIQTKLHYNAATYGQIMLLVGCAYLIGNIINRLLLQKLESMRMILIGLFASVITCFGMIIITWIQPLSIYTATIPVFVLFFWDGFVFPNMLTQCLQQYRQFPATAGALAGGYLNIVCSLFAFISAHIVDLHNALHVAFVFTALMIIALTIYPLTQPKHHISKSKDLITP